MSEHEHQLTQQPHERGPAIPPWLPRDYRWSHIPPETRHRILHILAPAYQQIVIEAPNEIERSIGTTFVHLMWLEICDQAKMATAVADPTCLDAIRQDPNAIERHLRLVGVKCKTATLLLKIQSLRQTIDRLPASTVTTLPPPPTTTTNSQSSPKLENQRLADQLVQQSPVASPTRNPNGVQNWKNDDSADQLVQQSPVASPTRNPNGVQNWKNDDSADQLAQQSPVASPTRNPNGVQNWKNDDSADQLVQQSPVASPPRNQNVGRQLENRRFC